MAQGGSHTIMTKKLAQALMESGMHHFDLGGPVQVGNGQASAAPIGGFVGSLLGGNNFQASGATIQDGTNNDQLSGAYDQAQSGIQGQQNLTNQVSGQVPTAVQNQQTLAQQLLNQSNGVGPNPAQDQLNQATGQNIAAQAALMASQRGASTNPGLVARNAAMQGANTQQQAIGQAATLGSQQQLAAQNSLANLSNQQVGQAQTANAANNSNIQGEQQQLQNANTQYNNNAVGMQSNINNVNAQTSASNAKQGGNIGGLVNGISGAISGVGSLFAEGGRVPGYSGGGDVSNSLSNAGPNIEATKPLPQDNTSSPSMPSLTPGAPAAASSTAMAGGAGDAIAELAPLAMLASKGALVPGKPQFKGNDYRNDVVPAELSKGEVVLPNSVTEIKDQKKRDAAAVSFMDHLKDVDDKKKDQGFGKVANAKKSLKERVEALEHCMGGKI